ncbi:prepilin peptidase [bacterium (Candidatus Gribaldobacteria) CG10_big_fil_rev_8_21_14_0_10_37_21]|uniref:Prepilin peptidase n=1 Tax=bacterium (Candidatus Gribaldobacteria) CG10_big_fil_rev_8_21_14_0_10_37_21 TaxID=2014275 RepID=A0A2H0UUU6_9BACT|nr:MAG: prepilin peptidase [bacterium (Candidatus Gribaldobacteria) CG10_big_fil_rev_8_21_14_0_10_37_21]
MFSLFFQAFIFIFGLIVGSFLNCLIYRLEIGKGKSILKGKSFCPDCQHTLAWFDLIPLLSFFLLKGKCRYCHKPISWQYPLVEVLTAFVFLLIAFKYKNSFDFFSFVILWSLLIIIFVYDLKHYIIPDKVVFVAIAIALIFNFQFSIFNQFSISKFSNFQNCLLAGIGAAGFFFLIWFFSKGHAMGFGDVKLAFLLGLLLGWPNILVGLMLAFFSGSLVGLGLIVAGKKKMSSQVPFGPFLIAGAFVALFWGQALWKGYVSLFN